MATKASMRQAKYDNAHCTGIYLKFNQGTDSDILEKLASVANRQGYIKQLIREDIKQSKLRSENVMNYRIKPEYFEQWGSDATEETVLTLEEVKSFADEWETPIGELMSQLYEDTPNNVAWYTGTPYLKSVGLIQP